MDYIAVIFPIILAYLSYWWLRYKNVLPTRPTHGLQQDDAPAEKSQEGKVGEYRMAEGNTLLRSSQGFSNRQPLEILYPGPDDPSKVDIEYVPTDLLGYVNLITQSSIVAVHGLGSHVDWSWTSKHGVKHVHWLKYPDMLPAKVPNARIMTYNYDSKWHRNAPRTRLHLCGKDLITNLHNFRNNVPNRPIIFIGHSLGGLVIQHACTRKAWIIYSNADHISNKASYLRNPMRP